jgi:hypothetical protein
MTKILFLLHLSYLPLCVEMLKFYHYLIKQYTIKAIRHSSTHSYPRSYMWARSQLHTPVTLTRPKTHETSLVIGSTETLCCRENFVFHSRSSNTDSLFLRLVDLSLHRWRCRDSRLSVLHSASRKERL